MTIAVHEFGHAATAMVVGRRIYQINIGRGAPFKTFHVRQTAVIVGRDMCGGHIIALPTGDERRWQAAIYYLGGVAGNFSMAALLLNLPGMAYGLWPSPWMGWAFSVAAGGALSNTLTGIRNLIPKNIEIDGRPNVSDGRKVLQLLRPRSEGADLSVHHDAFKGSELLQARLWAEAEAHYRDIFSKYANQPAFLGLLFHVLSVSKGPEAAASCAVEHQGFLMPSEQIAESAAFQWGFTWQNAAWAILRCPQGDLELASEFVRRTKAALPEWAYSHTVEGAMLVRSGQIAEGRELILSNLKDLMGAGDQLEFCDFILSEGLETDDLSRSDFEAYAAHLRTLA